MIYKEHGLTTEVAFNSALKKAGIEITSYIAPQEITTDVICTIDTTRHDSEIRADERTKAIDELINELKHNSTNISETGYQYHEYSDDELDEIAEQMKEVRNE